MQTNGCTKKAEKNIILVNPQYSWSDSGQLGSKVCLRIEVGGETHVKKSINVVCPSCNKQLFTDPHRHAATGLMRCPYCDEVFEVPAESNSSGDVPRVTIRQIGERTYQFDCPFCFTTMNFREQTWGCVKKCPSCKEVIHLPPKITAFSKSSIDQKKKGFWKSLFG